MAGSLPLKNDVQLITQFPQSRRQALDVLSAAESVPPISDSEVTCGPMTRPATLSSSATVIVELDGLQQQQQQISVPQDMFGLGLTGYGLNNKPVTLSDY